MRDRSLQGVEAVVQWQQCMPTEGDRNRLLLDRQNGRSSVLGSSRDVGRRRAVPPLGDCLLVDPVALRQSPQARFTMLYRSTDCLRRRGAAVENLAHSASLQHAVNNAPSKPGIKHLADGPGEGATPPALTSPVRAETSCGTRAKIGAPTAAARVVPPVPGEPVGTSSCRPSKVAFAREPRPASSRTVGRRATETSRLGV